MRIGWVKNELLHPVDHGGRIRTYHLLRALRREHHLTYIGLDDGSGGHAALASASEYCDVLVPVPFRRPSRHSLRYRLDAVRNLASPLPFTAWRYRSRAMRRAIEEVMSSGRLDVLVCDFIFPFPNLPPRPTVPVVLFQHNVEAALLERNARNAGSAVARTYFAEQARRMRRYEGTACRSVSGIVAVSPEDARTLESLYGVSDVGSIPTGVDVEFFKPSGSAPRRPEVVFLGALDWRPNTEGVQEFAREVWPLVRERHPSATFVAVGRNPSPPVLALAERTPGMRVEGDVPDVRPYLSAGSVFVVPLRIGGGTRLKIYEAMAMEIPVVSTAIGAEGLPVRDGEHLLLRDDPGGFADAVSRLLRDRREGEALADRAATFVRQECGWDRVAEQFTALLRHATQRA